jgi:hypothetical protein
MQFSRYSYRAKYSIYHHSFRNATPETKASPSNNHVPNLSTQCPQRPTNHPSLLCYHQPPGSQVQPTSSRMYICPYFADHQNQMGQMVISPDPKEALHVQSRDSQATRFKTLDPHPCDSRKTPGHTPSRLVPDGAAQHGCMTSASYSTASSCLVAVFAGVANPCR